MFLMFLHFLALFSWEYAVRDGWISGRVQPNVVALRFEACPLMAEAYWIVLLLSSKTSDEFRALLFQTVPRFLRFFIKSAVSVITSHFAVSTSFLHKTFMPTLKFTWDGVVWISWILEWRSKSRSLSLSKSFSSSDLALSKRKHVLFKSSFSPAFLVIRYLAVFRDKSCSGSSR